MAYKFACILPKGFKNKLYNIFFRYIPISILKKIPSSYAGYFKYYTPKAGDVVIDAGAYMGNYSILASRLVGKTGIVLAFEPDTIINEHAKKRMKKMRRTNIVNIPQGLLNKETTLEFSVAQNGSSSFFDKIAEGQTYTVNCTTLDLIAKKMKLKSIDFIKMDIEGAELEAIDGAIGVLKQFRPHVAIASYHTRNGEITSIIVEKKLKKIGYQVETSYPSHMTTYGVFK